MKNCDNCRYVTTSFDVPPCSECVCESKWEQPTNADRIRSMTDEELVKLLNNSLATCPPNTAKERTCRYPGRNCKQCWLEWLKQPYSESEGRV